MSKPEVTVTWINSWRWHKQTKYELGVIFELILIHFNLNQQSAFQLVETLSVKPFIAIAALTLSKKGLQ